MFHTFVKLHSQLLITLIIITHLITPQISSLCITSTHPRTYQDCNTGTLYEIPVSELPVDNDVDTTITATEEKTTTTKTLSYDQVDQSLSVKKQLVVLSFDGFRHDYVNTFNTPNLQQIAAYGVSAPDGYYPTFATKTFPTHWSIVTGLYEESHGIIDNLFYDPKFKEVFTRSKTDSKWFKGEPIWVTSRKHNQSANVLFWPGSAALINGLGPSFTLPYNESLTLEDRFNYLKQWIDDGVDLSMIYFHQPDKAGHDYGAFSNPVQSQVEYIDSLIGNLVEFLYLNNSSSSSKYSNVDLIITGDHGMVNKTSNGTIYLVDYISLSDVHRVSQLGPVSGLQPKPGKTISIYQALKNSSNPHFTVYLKEDIPERFHYKNHDRIMPIMMFAQEGYIIDTIPRERKRRKVGFHGYDNLLPSMRPLFYAIGPSFKSNYTTAPFDSVNLYPLFCHLLNINPASNNGSLENINHILSND